MRKKVYLIVLFATFACTVYYTLAVLKARENTPRILQTARARISIPVAKDDLPQPRLEALLRIQDQHFFSHGGTDFLARRVTTITQALVKFLYFDRFRPGLAKIKQSLIARFALDPLVSKDEQLYLFLSLAYFGEFKGQEIRGFGEAARVYFNKEIEDISDDEYLQLLAMLSGPNQYHVKLNPAGNAEQVAKLRQQLGSF